MIANFPRVRFVRILKNAKIGYTLVFAADDSYNLAIMFVGGRHFYVCR